MIDLESTAQFSAVQFPTGTSAQVDVLQELEALGVEAKLYDGEYLGPEGWRSLAIHEPNRWTPWAKPGDWVVVMSAYREAPALVVLVLTNTQYLTLFREAEAAEQ